MSLRLGRRLSSTRNPAGVIYGVLAVGTLIAAEGTRRETYESVIGASALALVLYWLAHAYAHHLGERIQRPEEWQPRDIGATLLHEAALVKGAALPIVALLLSWLAGAGLSAGVAAALWTAAIELLLLEVAAGVGRKLPRREMAIEVALGATLAVGILAIRVLLH
ncbi:MAG TPA: hypothetical protein VFG00_09040 [Acidothermaceae bacterium]|nr:hypothetical protein [Acidothermaceae bacterium]